VGIFVKGDIVVVPFPFSDVSAAKRRPALVLTDSEQDTCGDFILAQITSQQAADDLAVEIDAGDFENGALRHASSVRPSKLFTANEKIVLYKAGNLRKEKLREVFLQVTSLFPTE